MGQESEVVGVCVKHGFADIHAKHIDGAEFRYQCIHSIRLSVFMLRDWSFSYALLA
jgi:hypothetical protein